MNPTINTGLKIPSAMTYLHPISNTKLFGISQNFTASEAQTSISLYTHERETDSITQTSTIHLDEYVSSQLQDIKRYNDYFITQNYSKIFIIKKDDDKIKLEYTIDKVDIETQVLIKDNALYIVQRDEVKIVSLAKAR